nr:hypothetical protein [Bacteroidota bacterium]NOG58847.1 hypothetical protein [Bacteroidota bacterium]
MIETVSDLLQKFKEKEVQLLKEYEIVKHPGLIGDMYEGLTKDILKKSLFKGLDLKVSSGKIRSSPTNFSGEIDCMLVIGDGEQIPHTDKYIYDIEKVVVVIQVKKNLYSKDLKDSYHNLKSVIDITDDMEGKPYHKRLVRDIYSQLCRDEVPKREELSQYPIDRQMVYHSILLDAYYPIRIVWAYNGLKSEYSLRNKYVKLIEENITTDPKNKKKGYGPVNFPNLIICKDNSLIKTNGMPFGTPIDIDDWWSFFASSNKNPVYYFLEIIWSRLQYMFDLSSDIFGEDLTYDKLHGLLCCRFREMKELKGWQYFHVDLNEDELSKIEVTQPDWEPNFLTQTQFIALNILCRESELCLKSNLFMLNLIKADGETVDKFKKDLMGTGLVYFKNDKLLLLTENCRCGITPDGKFFADDDKSGRVSRWLDKNYKKK